MRAIRAFGMLPTENSSYWFKLWGIISLFLAGIGLCASQSLSIPYVHSTNDLVKEFFLLYTTSTVAIKIFLFNLHRQHLYKIFDIMKTLDKRTENEKEFNIMRKVYAYCRRVTNIFMCSYGGTIPSLFLELVFLDRTKRTWKSTALVPNDFAQKPPIYYSILAIESIGNSINCILACAIESFAFILISLLCGYIEVFSLKLQQIGNSKRQSRNHNKRRQLLEYLNHYNLLIEYVFY